MKPLRVPGILSSSCYNSLVTPKDDLCQYPLLIPKRKTFPCSAITFLHHRMVLGTPESCTPPSALSGFVHLIGHCHGCVLMSNCHERKGTLSGTQRYIVSGCPRELVGGMGRQPWVHLPIILSFPPHIPLPVLGQEDPRNKRPLLPLRKYRVHCTEHPAQVSQG